MNRDVVFCSIMLRRLRQEAKELGVAVPKGMTCLRCGRSKSGEGWFLVESCDGFREEVYAHNAFDARGKVISKLIDAWCRAHPDEDTTARRVAAFDAVKEQAGVGL